MTEIFDKLKEMNITPNTYYVLHCIKEDIIPASYVNKQLECTRLQNDGWLKEDLSLTAKSIIFMEEINSFFKKTKKKTTTDLKYYYLDPSMGETCIGKCKVKFYQCLHFS